MGKSSHSATGFGSWFVWVGYDIASRIITLHGFAARWSSLLQREMRPIIVVIAAVRTHQPLKNDVRSAVPRRNSILRDIEAEHLQFAVNSRRSPGHISNVETALLAICMI